jgi:hypothetical protein
MVGTRTERRNGSRRKRADLVARPLVAVLAGACLLALSYLWLCGRCEAMARDLKRLEQERAETHRRRVNEEYKWSNLRTLQNVRAALARFEIPMAWPGEAQVIHLARPLYLEAAPPPAPEQFAFRGPADVRHD